MKKRIERKKDPSLNDVENMVDSLLPCPFCGCTIGILITQNWGFQWYGEHCQCILEGNPSASYGRPESLVEDWNSRRKPRPKRRANESGQSYRKRLEKWKG